MTTKLFKAANIYEPVSPLNVGQALEIVANIKSLPHHYGIDQNDKCLAIEAMIERVNSKNVRFALFADLRDECQKIVLRQHEL